MKSISFISALIFIFLGCQKNVRTAHNGIDIEVIREGEGPYANPNEVVVANMLYKDSKDSVWSDTRIDGIPIFFPVSDTSNIKYEKSIESVFRVCKKGDSLRVKVTSKSWFEDVQRRQVPSNVKPDEFFTFLLGIVDIKSAPSADSLKLVFLNQLQEKERMKQAEQLTKDTIAINNYLSSKNIKAIKDSSGVYYLITKAGEGNSPKLSSKVKVNYKGMLMENGSVFDESKQPIEFALNALIPGWQIGFQKLQKGAKATLYIPSTLGYGATGYPPEIPPNSNLIFEVELLDFETVL